MVVEIEPFVVAYRAAVAVFDPGSVAPADGKVGFDGHEAGSKGERRGGRPPPDVGTSENRGERPGISGDETGKGRGFDERGRDAVRLFVVHGSAVKDKRLPCSGA